MTGKKRGLHAYQAALAEWASRKREAGQMTEIAVKPQPVLQEVTQLAAVTTTRAAMTPMEMLSMAVSNGAGIEVLERLMALQERWQAGQARRAFDEAIAAAKAEIKPVRKNRNVGYEAKGGGEVGYAHEDMGEIARSVDPILAKYGLSYRYRTNQRDGVISVTTIVCHSAGHSEETTLSAGADTSGKKNSIQAIGSTITYLQRYGIKAALGLAAAKDDDGKQVDAPDLVTDAQIDDLIKLADAGGVNKPALCKWLGVASFKDIPAGKIDYVRRAIEHKASITRTTKGKAHVSQEVAHADH